MNELAGYANAAKALALRWHGNITGLHGRMLQAKVREVVL